MSYLLTVALVLALLIVLCVLAEFFRLSIIAYGVRNSLQESVISVAVTNYDEVYDGLREGYSGGYLMTGDGWEETLDYGDVYTQLDRLLGTNPDGTYHVKWQGNRYEYRITDLNAVLNYTAGQWYIEDLDSTNGIRIQKPDGRIYEVSRTQPCQVEKGDILFIGLTRLAAE